MDIKKYKREILRLAGNMLLHKAITALCRTLSINIKNEEAVRKLAEENKNYVLAFWHGTMLVPWYINRGLKFTALVSRSKDGALLDKILNKWDYQVVRGSSHTGGSVALGMLVDYARDEKTVVITPDGPRGPKHKLKAGAVITARRANVPLVLLGVGYNKKRNLNSWDRFEIPKFFSKVNLIFSDPIYVSADLSFEDTSKIIGECELKLNELQTEADCFNVIS
ncbi:MAG: lysophospholipid acyltransferase family protein [Ignavibacteria bacterium]